MNSTVKTVAFWLVILLSGVLLWQVVKQGGSGAKETATTFSKFMQDVDHGDVSEVTITGTEVHGKYKGGNAGFHCKLILHLRVALACRGQDTPISARNFTPLDS